MDSPQNRKDLESKGLDAEETLEYVHEQLGYVHDQLEHVHEQLILCLEATEDPDVEDPDVEDPDLGVEEVQQRYSDLAEKLRCMAEELDD